MYSSRYYKNLANSYANTKCKLQNTIQTFENVEDILNSVSQKLEAIIIGEKGIDDGQVVDELNKIKSAHNNIITMINECRDKIDTNESLYLQALANERQAKEAQKSE